MKNYKLRKIIPEIKRPGFFKALYLHKQERKNFEVKNGRKMNSEELEKSFVQIYPDRIPIFEGCCPLCEKETIFLDGPKREREGEYKINLLKNLGLLLLNPKKSLQSLFAADVNARPYFCNSCDEPILICPKCNMALNRFPIDTTKNIECSNCSAKL